MTYCHIEPNGWGEGGLNVCGVVSRLTLGEHP